MWKSWNLHFKLSHIRVCYDLAKNVRLGYKWVAAMNKLTYDSAEFISTIESFTPGLTHRCKCWKLHFKEATSGYILALLKMWD